MANGSNPMELFHASGEPLYRLELKDGVPHGLEQTWGQPGVLTQRAHFQAGKLHGAYESWWDNGSPKERGAYVNGRKVGVYYWYDQSGNVWSKHDFGAA